MEILETTPVFTTSLALTIITLASFSIVVICVMINADGENIFLVILSIICALGFIVGFVLTKTVKIPTERNQYLVKIDKNYPIAKVVEQYDIIEVRNADTGLYLLEDKKG